MRPHDRVIRFLGRCATLGSFDRISPHCSISWRFHLIDSKIFSSSNEAAKFIQARIPLPRQAWDDVKTAEIIEELGIVSKEPANEPPPDGGIPALVKRYRWVIRNDDLNLLDSILEGVKGSASAGFFFAAGVAEAAKWGAVVGLVSALFKICRSILLRGQQLSPDLFTALVALKNGGPATVDELSTRLATADAKWSAALVTTVLDSLKSLPMGDGTVRQLVAKGENERWQVSGV
jgi:hypothetical protein